MLIGIFPFISSELLATLHRMRHGEDATLVIQFVELGQGS